MYGIIRLGDKMKKIILIDGNNLLFRSYYATIYAGNMMKNSKGFPTNALYGFVSMINKIINEEKPSYIMIAFDKGKTFRHDLYLNYKEGRIETPDDLKKQFPIAKQILDCMNVKYIEVDNYEADDIIGTIAKMVDNNDDFIGTIISSDKDLLQLISSDINIKLLKQKDYILYDSIAFQRDFGINPINIIDLKALQGDPSDKIPGVKGIGEKTALPLIQEYGNIDTIYNNIDKIEGKLKTKLINDRSNAYLSKELATICKEVPVNVNLEDLKYDGVNCDRLTAMYEELEFYSLLKSIESTNVKTIKNENVKIINSLNDLKIDEDSALYLEILGDNYHTSQLVGVAIYNKNLACYIPYEVLKNNPGYTFNNIRFTYDLKKVILSLKWNNINISTVDFDLMIASYLLNYNIKNDISYLANQLGYNILFHENIFGKENKNKKLSDEYIGNICVQKAKFIYENHDKFINELKSEEMIEVYENIEMPLVSILADMEFNGVNININTLNNIGIEIQDKINLITKDIYNMAGIEFNISSPKQLSELLFNKLNLLSGRRGKEGNSTDKKVLYKLKDSHPIISKILEYRTLTKIYGTYIEGLKNNILFDNKIHTIFTQTLTRTGRLSSIEPNLQNIPIKNEEGRIVRKAFIPTGNSILMSADYSQIELRILAHFSNASNLIEAFKNDMDIHTKTAMDIFNVKYNEVTKDMRNKAKAVNFGIIYGISSFGLSENLDIDVKEAKVFINKYLDAFPGIKQYMDNVKNEAYLKGSVKTIANRKRVINELNNSNHMIRMQGERMALNTPIQGSSADIIKKAMIDIYNKMNELQLKSKMILQVHDELVFDVVKEEKNIMAKIVKDIMENSYNLNVLLKVDINFGNDWYDVK